MAGLNWVDLLLMLFMLGALVMGFRQGLIRQLIGLLALYLAGIIAVQYYRPFADLLRNGFKATPGTVLQGVAFLAVVLAIMILINGLTYEAYKTTHIRFFPILDRTAGAAIGTVNVVILILLLLMPLNYMVHAEGWSSMDSLRSTLQSGLDTSALVRYFNGLLPTLIASIRPWLPAGIPSIFDL